MGRMIALLLLVASECLAVGCASRAACHVDAGRPVTKTTFAATVPAECEVVSLMTGGQEEFMSLPRVVRRERFVDADYRNALADGKWYQRPVELTWIWGGQDDEAMPVFTVEVKRAKDGLPVALLSSTTTNASVDNLEIATEYVWCVTPVLVGRKLDIVATGRFTTADNAPRTIRIDGVANSRDLGGRIGLGGRRVRQGLVFRTAGFNANATPVFFTEKELHTPGIDFSRKEKERRTDGKPPRIIKERKRGKDFITESGRRYVLGTLGVRTDIDLRSDVETAGMTGSPLGETCRWIHVPSCCYGMMASDKGRAAFAKVFRVFLDRKNYPIAFHCIAGQDRTGAVAFILNGLLGVAEEELYRDWEASGFWNRTTKLTHASHIDKLVECFDKYEGESLNDRIFAYVKSLGFTDEDIGRFREIMLE